MINETVTRLDCKNCKGDPNWIKNKNVNGSVFFKGHQGVGDSVYQRPFIKAACEHYEDVYLETPWPQIYWDLPVKCVKINSYFRTQRINVEKQNKWYNVPYGIKHTQLKYTVRGFKEDIGILEQFNRQHPLGSFDLTMPIKDEWAVSVPDKFVVVRYPTLRNEWLNPARNCKAEYIQQCVDYLKDDYTIISIAHVKEGQEWFVQEPRGCDLEFHHGEYSIEQIAWLLSKAELCVTPVGFMLPLGWAVGCKTITIFGGGQQPSLLTHPKFDSLNLLCIAPDPFCNCQKMDHSCNKEIENLQEQLFTFLGEKQ